MSAEPVVERSMQRSMSNRRELSSDHDAYPKNLLIIRLYKAFNALMRIRHYRSLLAPKLLLYNSQVLQLSSSRMLKVVCLVWA